MTLDQQLQQFLPAENIKSRSIDCISYASDAGFYQLVPQAVVLPRHIVDIQQLFAFAHKKKIPLVFRAGGTSLSGQSITDGILVDISRFWKKVSVEEQSNIVRVQPGITGGMVNHYLKKHGKKIGPDPASINAAMMGGILSNNASGMCCGVVHNSYHTLRHLHFVMTDGNAYDSGVLNDYDRFTTEQALLCQTLIGIRWQLRSNPVLEARIRRKYRTKNTVGYSLNALIDYEHPLDIFAHLLIGGEGTLAFIAEATMLTLPDKQHKATAMLYFPGIYEACSAIMPLKETGAEALELMDRASLKSVEHLPGLPDFFTTLPDGAAALLCEYQTETADELQQILERANATLKALPLLKPASFTTIEKEGYFFWKLRQGMFPSVGAVRKRGTTVILEDVAFPVEKLAPALIDLIALFDEFGYHDAIIFGHAKDGNIHFVITQLLDTVAEISRYDRFMKAMVKLVIEKYDGSLKGEHGTGRNMAPFIETEWGGDAYEMMKAIKHAADPHNVLNPGVIINSSKDAHIENLKDLPQVEEEVDKCIECGFCEVNCPSRDLTMTPRRRIVARRALQRMRKTGDKAGEQKLLKEYHYDGLDTCATDGLCATDCPVDINTGELVKRLRSEQHGAFGKSVAGFIARHYHATEKIARLAIGFGAAIDGFAGWKIITQMTHGLRKIIPSMPVWMHSLYAAKALPDAIHASPDVIYFSSCINRVMKHGTDEKSLQQTILDLSNDAGLQVYIPPQIGGHCCGQPFTSKGYFEAGITLLMKTIDALLEWTQQGKVPVMCDFSSCTYTFLQNAKKLPLEYQHKFALLQVVDSVEYLQQQVLPRLNIQKSSDAVVLHPTCAVTKLYLNEAFSKIAQACSQNVHIPASAGCCGMAGDRGFLFPELIASATLHEAEEANRIANAKGYSSSSTCEMALSQQSNVHYRHIAYLIDETMKVKMKD